MTYDDIKQLVQAEMAAVDERIKDKLASEVALVNQLGYYIVNSGGKRLRPVLLILMAKALGYEGKQHINLAAVIEFIHTATLLHDDVVDESDQRRGNETANALFGNAASVLVGDYLYSRSFQMMIESNSLDVMNVLADTTNKIAEGEVMQLMNINDADTSMQAYMAVIEHKTATLFEAATHLAGILTETPESQLKAIREYGLYLGNAFQMIDDALDYAADEAELGKSLGDDLAEGKPTLPLILAMQSGSEEQAQIIRAAIEQGSREQFSAIKAIIDDTGSLDKTKDMALAQAQLAKDALDFMSESEFKRALLAVADLAVERAH